LPLFLSDQLLFFIAIVPRWGEGNKTKWGMIAAAAGLVLVGVFFAIKRLRASKQSDAIG